MTTVAAGAVPKRASARATALTGGLHPFGVFVLLAGAFMPIMDFFITNVALPGIDASLHASSPELELVPLTEGHALGWPAWAWAQMALAVVLGYPHAFSTIEYIQMGIVILLAVGAAALPRFTRTRAEPQVIDA